VISRLAKFRNVAMLNVGVIPIVSFILLEECFTYKLENSGRSGCCFRVERRDLYNRSHTVVRILDLFT
jgi:hypothetical protein